MNFAESLILIIWTLISIYILRYIGFFRAAPLNRAPERKSSMGVLVFGGVIILYISLLVIAVSVVKFATANAAPMLSDKDKAAMSVASTQAATSQAATTTYTDYLPIMLNMLAQNAVGLIIVVVITFIAHATTRGGIRDFGFDRRKIVSGFLIGLLAIFLLWPWMSMLQAIVIHLGTQIRGGPTPIHPVLEMLRKGPPEIVKYTLVATAVIFAPLIEETMFRGLLQTALLKYFRRDSVGRWWAIAIASLIFVSIHFQNGPQGINWEHFAPLFLLSCVLGYLYERTGNLWTNISLHALFNAVVTIETLRNL